MTQSNQPCSHLKNLLAKGILKDNRVYKADNGDLTDRQSKVIGRFDGQYEPSSWRFLNEVTFEVNLALKNKPKDSLILFNDQAYEHNSDDDFLSVSGIDSKNFTLETGNIIGFVKRGNHTLKVSSRFGDPFLKYIIADADGFLELDNLGGDSPIGDYDWLLAYLWTIKLKRALRLGLPKVYKSYRERIPKVRGRLDPVDFFINKELGQYLCSYREHSYDSPAISLFMATYQQVKHYDFCKSSHSHYHALVMANQGIKRSRQDILKTPYFSNPFYQDYNVLIDLSKRVLMGRGADFGIEQDNSTFLFDVSMLFEYFIVKLLKRNGFDLLEKFGTPKTIFTGAMGDYKRKLEPDILFKANGGLYVFDIKYKYYDRVYGTAREDMFQLHTYIGQYGNDHNVKGCGFIYPISEKRWKGLEKEDNKSIISGHLQQQGKDIPFHILFLVIPEEDPEFLVKMPKACAAFIQTIAAIDS